MPDDKRYHSKDVDTALDNAKEDHAEVVVALERGSQRKCEGHASGANEALINAARSNDTEEVRRCLRAARIRRCCINYGWSDPGMRLLSFAAGFNNVECMALLYEAGADLDTSRMAQYTVICGATSNAARSGHIMAVEGPSLWVDWQMTNVKNALDQAKRGIQRAEVEVTAGLEVAATLEAWIAERAEHGVTEEDKQAGLLLTLGPAHSATPESTPLGKMEQKRLLAAGGSIFRCSLQFGRLGHMIGYPTVRFAKGDKDWKKNFECSIAPCGCCCTNSLLAKTRGTQRRHIGEPIVLAPPVTASGRAKMSSMREVRCLGRCSRSISHSLLGRV